MQLANTQHRGMTLLEMLVVMALLSGFFILSVPFIHRRENLIRSTFRQMKAINRQLDSAARLNAKVYRLVFALSGSESSTWWVEKQIQPKLLSKSEDVNSENSNKNKSKLSVTKESKVAFVTDESFFKEPKKLPENLIFESIIVNNKLKPAAKKAYIYYYPEGQSYKILITIKGKKQYWSLVFDRLQGDLDILQGNKTWQDIL